MHYADTFTLAGRILGVLLQEGLKTWQKSESERQTRKAWDDPQICGGPGTVKKNVLAAGKDIESSPSGTKTLAASLSIRHLLRLAAAALRLQDKPRRARV